VSWEEIDDDIRGAHFNLHNLPARLAKLSKDPWAGYWKAKQALARTMIEKLARMRS
jgi:bifunctional non-homologous end joining protein LigD